MKKLILGGLMLAMAGCSALGSNPTPLPVTCLEQAGIVCAAQSWGDQALMAKCMAGATLACVQPSPVATPAAK